MNKSWLWDIELSVSEAKRILKNPGHREFFSVASLLLARNNQPSQIFKEYIDPLSFCEHWAQIKKRMAKDKWNERIVFWQAIYEKLVEKYRKNGIKFREKKDEFRDEICKRVGNDIRRIRKEKGLSQKALAKKLGGSQQLISRIEKGKENMSLITLKNILKVLDRKIKIGQNTESGL